MIRRGAIGVRCAVEESVHMRHQTHNPGQRRREKARAPD
jgi:hypothetical protein